MDFAQVLPETLEMALALDLGRLCQAGGLWPMHGPHPRSTWLVRESDQREPRERKPKAYILFLLACTSTALYGGRVWLWVRLKHIFLPSQPLTRPMGAGTVIQAPTKCSFLPLPREVSTAAFSMLVL